ncbi:MAG: hypothetical protein Kow0042_15230 [Calditrichia bacterium]
MFIRKVTRRIKKKEYTYYRLVESVRIGDKVRQHTLLNRGPLPLPQEKHPQLVRRIQDYLSGQLPFSRKTRRLNLLPFIVFSKFAIGKR